MIRMSPQVATRPRWLYDFAPTGQIPDLTAPTLAAPGEQQGPTFFGAYYEWMTTPPPSWAAVAWMAEPWQQISGCKPFLTNCVCRIVDAKRTGDPGVGRKSS